MGDEVGVERVVARHEHAEPALPLASGPADLLPHRGPGAREARHHAPRRGRRCRCRARARWSRPPPSSSPDLQLLLELAPVLRQVAAAVRRDPSRQVRVDLVQRAPGVCSATVSAPRRLRTNASVRTPSATRSASRSAVSADAERRTGAPCSPTQRRQRRLPQRDRGLCPAASRRTSTAVDRCADQPGRGHLGLGGRRRGQHEGRARRRSARRPGAAGAGSVRRATPKTPR